MRLINLKNLQKPKTREKKEQKSLTFTNAIRLLKGRRRVLNGFEIKTFPIRPTQGKGQPSKITNSCCTSKRRLYI